jgi:hypothetical protein
VKKQDEFISEKNLRCKFKQFLSEFFLIFIFFILISLCFGAEKIYINKSSIILGDGDTFSYTTSASTSPIILRFLGVDTPEVAHLPDGFQTSQYLGEESAEFTKKQILKAKTVSYIPYKTDFYGRTLAYIFVDDELLPVRIIKAGLGYETVSFYKKKNADQSDELKAFGEIIKNTAEEVGQPNFQNPFFWRQKNRNKTKD